MHPSGALRSTGWDSRRMNDGTHPKTSGGLRPCGSQGLAEVGARRRSVLVLGLEDRLDAISLGFGLFGAVSAASVNEDMRFVFRFPAFLGGYFWRLKKHGKRWIILLGVVCRAEVSDLDRYIPPALSARLQSFGVLRLLRLAAFALRRCVLIFQIAGP